MGSDLPFHRLAGEHIDLDREQRSDERCEHQHDQDQSHIVNSHPNLPIEVRTAFQRDGAAALISIKLTAHPDLR